jgi:hypothetical protein
MIGYNLNNLILICGRRNFLLNHYIPKRSVVRPASYPRITGSSSTGSKKDET